MKPVCKIAFLIIILQLNVIALTAFQKDIIIQYPKFVESYRNQVLNIPVVCENVSNQSITLLPDFVFDIPGYRINNIKPKTISPMSKDVMFISVIPENSLVAGSRFLPFALRDLTGKLVNEGIIEIKHNVVSGFELIPINSPAFIIGEIPYSLSLFLTNTGSVPLQIEFKHLKQKFFLNPDTSDTLNVVIKGADRDFWYNFELSYEISYIKPDKIEVENNIYSLIIPIARRGSISKRRDFYTLPFSLSQSISYDKHSNYLKTYYRQHRTTLSAFGHISDYPSAFLGLYISNRISNFNSKTDNETYFNFFIKSNKLSLNAGETSYDFDLNKNKRYGQGYDLNLKLGNFIFQNAFIKELYRDRPAHSLNSVGYFWETDSYLYEPQQYIMFKYYRKLNKNHNNKWFSFSEQNSLEHDKYILNTRFKAFENINLNLEIFTVKDSLMQNRSNPKFASELLYKNQNINYRLYFYNDKGKVVNESNYKYKIDNEINFNLEFFDLYSAFSYNEEKLNPEWSYHSHNAIKNIYLNAYVKTLPGLFFRNRFYNSQTNVYFPNNSFYKEEELLFGLLTKSTFADAEILIGYKNQNFHKEFRWKLYEFNLNFYSDFGFNMLISNQIMQRREQIVNTDIKHTLVNSQMQTNFKWNSFLKQSFGVKSMFHNRDLWRNSLSCFNEFIYTLPWEHTLKTGFNYGFNPRLKDSTGDKNTYSYTLYAEYRLPLRLPVSVKSNRNYYNISLFDPWQQKPVSGAIFNFNNVYYITDEKGKISIDRSHINNNNVSRLNLINLPSGFDLNPGLQTISKDIMNKQVKSSELQIVKLAELNVSLKLKEFNEIPLYSNERHKDKRVAYQNKKLIDLDDFYLSPLNKRMEFILQSESETIIFNSNANGKADLKNLKPGKWVLRAVPESSATNRLSIEKPSYNIEILPGHKNHIEIIYFEDYIPFTDFNFSSNNNN